MGNGWERSFDELVNPSPSLNVIADCGAGHSAATAQISYAAVWSAAMDVGGWLRGLGLGKYEAAFLDNGIGEAVLPHLTVEDLKDIGVFALGDPLQYSCSMQSPHWLAQNPFGPSCLAAEACSPRFSKYRPSAARSQ
jgi:hypothetical protein